METSLLSLLADDSESIARRTAAERRPCLIRPMTPNERKEWPPLRPTRDELKESIAAGLWTEAIAEKYGVEPRRVWMLARRNNLVEKLEINAKKAHVPMYSPGLPRTTPGRTSQILAPDMLRQQTGLITELLPALRRIVRAVKADNPDTITADEREFADLIGELAAIASRL